MKPFLHPDIPAPAKVLSLVRLHHGLPSGAKEEIPMNALMRGSGLTRIWHSGAKLNQLSARRRRIELEDIPASAFPVVLELGRGSQFLVLKEKHFKSGNDFYIVQFPDARESLVRAERIREIYDGTCVFLRPRAAVPGGGGALIRGGWVDHFGPCLTSFLLKRGTVAAIFCHFLTLAGVAGVVVSHRLAFPETVGGAIPVSVTGVFMAAAVVMGILRLRREVITKHFSSAPADRVFLPVYGLSLFLLPGWLAVPFFGVAGFLIAVLLLPARPGQAASRLRQVRRRVVAGTFFTGAFFGVAVASFGLLSPALMAGALVLGTCLINLLIESDVFPRKPSLATLNG